MDEAGTSDERTEWYFDLELGVAVPADARGRPDHLLGPYRTKADAENWRALVEERNTAWDDADAEWDAWGEPSG